MNMDKSFEILDCTLRDGGYSNDWHFDKSVAARLYTMSERNGCSYFELGFRFSSQGDSRILGPFAFSKPNLLNVVTEGKKSGKVKIGFMINADEFEGMPDEQLERLLGRTNPEHEDSFDFVRVATRPRQLSRAIEVCEFLLRQGYQVMVNLMQAHNLSENDLRVLATTVNLLAKDNSKGFLSHVYLADTMGAMTPNEVLKKVQTLKGILDCDIGFHGHDNLRLALANSLAAIDAGASVVDGTLTGIGRGIGNTRVELLYLIRNAQSQTKFLAKLMALGTEFFAENKNTYIEESSYALSGALKVHPNYVDAFLQNGQERFHQIPEVFSELTDEEKSSFSKFGADLSSIWYGIEKQVTERSRDEFQRGQDSFLLVAPGPTAITYKHDLVSFSKSKRIPLGVLSSKQNLPPDAVDYYFCSYPLTFLTGDFRNGYSSKVVAPFGSIPSAYKRQIDPGSRIEYGLRVSQGDFLVTKNYLTAPSARVHIYAMAYLASQGIQNIYLAGFDGYRGADSRNNEFMDFIRRLREVYPNLGLRTLTPTTYDLDTEQLFL